MTEQSPGTESGLRPWLARHWRFALVLAALWGIELALALRTGAHGDPMIYWLYIMDQTWPQAYFYACLLVALLGVMILIVSRRNRWQIWILLAIIYLLPLPAAQFRGGTVPLSSVPARGQHGFLRARLTGDVHLSQWKFHHGLRV